MDTTHGEAAAFRGSHGDVHGATSAGTFAEDDHSALVEALCAIGLVGCRPGQSESPPRSSLGRKFRNDWLWRVVDADAYRHQVVAESPWESIRFEGDTGSLGLMLLPDSNFVAWDELLGLLARRIPRRAGRSRLDRGPWWACRFERIEVTHARLVPVPATSLSPCGRCVLTLVGQDY